MLYDTLRPLIIHLQHLETLSELTSILRCEVLGHHLGNSSGHLEPFEDAIGQLLQDVQERLVYRLAGLYGLVLIWLYSLNGLMFG